MLPPGHIAAGYIIGRAVAAYANASPEYEHLLAFLGIVAGVIPDIDFIPFFFKHKSFKLKRGDSHRNYITHAPLVWFLLGISIYFLNYSSLVRYIGIVLWFGTWSHFLGDSLEYGIRWFWPFRNRYYSALPAPSADTIEYEEGTIAFYWKYIRGVYFRSWTTWLEGALIILALFVFFFA